MAGKFNFATLLLVVAVLVQGTTAAVYVVGDNFGWNVSPGAGTVYSNWTASHKFAVGDILVFNFTTGYHDVAEVTMGSFDTCSATTPLFIQTVGPANVTLNSTGDHYFICTFGMHCLNGQKIKINVPASTAATPLPAASPSPTPSASPTTTPPPASSPAPKGSPPSPAPSPSTTATPPPTSTGPTTPPTPPPPASASPPGSSPPPSSPSGSSPPPPAPPPPSAAQPKAVATLAVVFMSFAVGILC